MRTCRRLAALLLLLSLPLPGYCFDMEFMLRDIAQKLLQVAAGALGIVALLVATVSLLKQLRKPEAANPTQRLAAGLRIGLLIPPAAVVVYWVLAWFFYGFDDSSRYLVIFSTGLLGVAACLLLWWRQRPTAASVILGGLLIASTGAAATGWLKWPVRKPPAPPMLLGLLGNPVFPDASPPAASTEAADTSYVYTDIEQMPGFRGAGTALKNQANAELHYPALARAHGVAGLVQVTFTVLPTGGITRIRVTQSLSPECDEEAVRVTKLLAPGFAPGSQNGRPVPVRETLSFGFGPNPAAQ